MKTKFLILGSVVAVILIAAVTFAMNPKLQMGRFNFRPIEPINVVGTVPQAVSLPDLEIESIAVDIDEFSSTRNYPVIRVRVRNRVLNTCPNSAKIRVRTNGNSSRTYTLKDFFDTTKDYVDFPGAILSVEACNRGEYGLAAFVFDSDIFTLQGNNAFLDFITAKIDDNQEILENSESNNTLRVDPYPDSITLGSRN